MMRQQTWPWLVGVLVLAILGGAQESAERSLRPRRLYFGAPPTVPHEVGAEMRCQLCHNDPDMGVPLTPHPERLRCRQCHVAVAEDSPPFRSSTFSGLTPPARAPRVQPLAPPLIPHPVLLRENCLACHNPESGKDVIATTHPERLRCRQCHIPQRPSGPLFPERKGG